MEEEINVREYVAVLIRYWKWIASLAILAAVAALVVSFLLPATYEASAVVVITKPRYVMRFDERLETVKDIQQPTKAYPVLAMGDDLLLQAMAAMNPPLPEAEQDLSHLRSKLKATASNDPNVIELRAGHNDAKTAAEVVNAWADVFVERVNELYESDQDVQFFEQRLADADESLRAAEQALIEFQGRNQAAILAAQLASARQDVWDYAAEQREIERVVRNARALQERTDTQQEEARADLDDELAALLLYIQAFSIQTSQPVQTSSYDAAELTGEINLSLTHLSSENPSPIQLQISGSALLSLERTVGELTALLEGLVTMLEARQDEINTRVALLESQILTLQQQLEVVETEKDRLTRARDVARETHLILSRKVDETRIAAQDESGGARRASYAAVPTKPVSPRKLLNTAVAGALGLFTGVFGAFALAYWRQEQPCAQPPSTG